MVAAALVLAATTPAWGQSNTKPDQLDCWELVGFGGVSFATKAPVWGVDVVRYSRSGSGIYAEAIVYGAPKTPGADLGFGYTFAGDVAFVRGSLLGGIGPVRKNLMTSNDVFRRSTDLRQISPEIGVQVAAGLVLGGGFDITLSAAYRLPVGVKSNTAVNGLTIDSEKSLTPDFTASLGLGWKICGSNRYDGDHATQLFASCGLGANPYASIAAEWFQPMGWSWFLHYGAEYQMGIKDQLSKVLVFTGFQYRIEDQWHDDSWLLITLDPIKVGLGEAQWSATTYSQTEAGWLESKLGNTQPGLAVAGYLGVEILPAKCFDWKTKYQLAIRVGYEPSKVFIPGVKIAGVDKFEIEKNNPVHHGVKIGVGLTF